MEIKTLKSSFHGNVKKIYHTADIHIRLSSDRHKEYREVFGRLYELLKESTENSIIVVCGDILHSKNELSPECVDLTIEFIKNLSGIMDVILIMGNHDGNLSNKTKMDSLSPLIREIKGKHQIHYLLNSGVYKYNNINFGVSSIFDDQFINATDIENDGNLKIALYHNAVQGSITDVGHRLNSELTIDAFNGYDYALLGDIHKFQYMDENKRICYPSSLIQQNYGESLNNHGIVIWDLINEISTFKEIRNDYGYCCVNIKNGKIFLGNANSPKNPRIKLIGDNTDGITVKELSQKLRKKYDIQELTYSFIGNNKLTKKTANDKTNTEIHQNLQDVNYQNTLIKDYIVKNMTLTEKEINDIIEINNKMNTEIVNLIVHTNKWKLLNIDFSNMFCYGQKNEINFNKLEGIVGLFAPNYSGKSSIVDIILFTLFDKCSRGLRTDILNQKKNQFHCRINLEIDGCEYVIMRIGKFPKKNAKSIKIDVHFWKKNPSPDNEDDEYLLLNGIDRNETNKIISNYIGTFDDYIMTSFCLQKEIGFLDYPQSKKKEFLMKMLKLNIYEQLLENAKSENKLKTLQLKDLSTKTKNVDIYELRNKLSELQKSKEDNDNIIEKLNVLIENYHSKNEQLHKKLIQVKKPSVEIVDQNEILNNNNKKIANLKNKIPHLQTNMTSNETELIKLKQNYNKLDPENIIDKYNLFNNEKNNKINKLNLEIKKLYNSKKSVREYIKNIQEYNNEKKNMENKINELNMKINTCDIKITNEDKEIIKDNIIDNIKETYIEYIKITNDHSKQTIELTNIDNEINQMELKLDKLNKHKYNPECEFCINNIFVKDALQTKSQLNEKTNKRNEINKLILQTSKKLKLKKYSDIETKYNNINEMNQTNNLIANKIKDLNHKKELYIKDISIITNEISNLSKIIEDYNNDIENIKFNEEIENKIQRKEDDMKVLQNSKYELYDKYMELRDKILNIETFIHEKKMEMTKNNTLILELENANKILSNNIKEIETYNKNMENNKTINIELNKTKDSLSKSTTEIKRLQKEKDLLIEQMCYTKKEIESYENYTNEIKTLELETKAYLNYIKIINKDGLPYMLLNNLIPLLQEGANNLLLPLTNFSISIEQDDDNSINVYKIINNNKLNVELCSGFEKFVIGLSIRISLINLSKLSSCNFMLIDEGFSCMDSNNINNLTSLFNTLKDMFDFVIIISHLDSVKSQCDNYMTIKINSGFSNIVYE